MIAASSNHRLRTILIIAGSLLAIGGIAAGTILTLKHFTPVKMTSTSSETSVSSPLEKANELFAKGDYAGAKSAYENIRQTYEAQNNEAGVKDMDTQLQILDATAKSQKDPVNTDKNSYIMGGQAQ